MHIIKRMSYALISGHLKVNNFAFEKNRKLIILGVPIFKHIRVVTGVTYLLNHLPDHTSCVP